MLLTYILVVINVFFLVFELILSRFILF